MGEENQMVIVRPETESSVRLRGWKKSDFTPNGNLKREYLKSHSYGPTNNTLDSDGTLESSGTESDSSEDLHYGPGFVSRLKSRYMSVALRGSTGLYGKTGIGPRKRSNLRRTASLEDFLDPEKTPEKKDDNQQATNDDQPTSTKPLYAKNNSAATRNRPKPAPAAGLDSRLSRSKERSRQESMKRCQSVEVLSRTDRYGKRVSDKKKETDEPPPPLPPKSERPLENILNTSLANDKIVVDESTMTTVEPVDTTQVVRFRKAEVSTNTVASLRKPFHKRRSSGLLFGIEERELPAPDTVKETRKIFESFDKSSTSRRPSFLTKSQSTSNLYFNNRSPSKERNRDSAKTSTKKSEENLNRNSSPQRRVSAPFTSRSSLYRNVPAKVNSRPTPPSKTSNLNFPRKDSTDDDEAPTLPQKKTSTELPSKLSQTSSHESDEEVEGVKAISNDSLKNIRQSGTTFNFTFQSDKSTMNARNLSKSYLPNHSTSSKQVGVIKPITRETENISSIVPESRLHNNFLASDKKTTEVDRETEKEVIVIKKEELASPFSMPSKSSQEPIKNFVVPAEKKTSSARLPPSPAPWLTVEDALKLETEPPVAKPNGVRVVRDNGQILTATPAIINSADSSEDTEDSGFDPPEIIEPPPRFSEQEKPTIKFSEKPLKHVTTFEKPALKPVENKLPFPLILKPVREQNKSEPANTQQKTLHLNQEKTTPVVKPLAVSTNSNNKQMAMKSTREQEKNSKNESPVTDPVPLKPPKKTADSVPSSNTMVFNFVNSDKSISHIENDGLDMSKRNRNIKNVKNSGVVILADVGESTDGAETDSDVEDVDHNRPPSPCNVTFVGANVVHGKSSIRSKQKIKKMKITFSKDLPEVFEYPSYETVSTNGSLLKSPNSSVNSFGGLGSYTPSKIGFDESFQLGVTRTPVTTGAPTNTSKESDEAPSPDSLWPEADAKPWSGSTSGFSDILF